MHGATIKTKKFKPCFNVRTLLNKVLRGQKKMLTKTVILFDAFDRCLFQFRCCNLLPSMIL